MIIIMRYITFAANVGILGRDESCIALKIIVHSQKKNSLDYLCPRFTRPKGIEGSNIYFLKNVFFQTQETSTSNDTSPYKHFLTQVVRNSPEKFMTSLFWHQATSALNALFYVSVSSSLRLDRGSCHYLCDDIMVESWIVFQTLDELPNMCMMFIKRSGKSSFRSLFVRGKLFKYVIIHIPHGREGTLVVMSGRGKCLVWEMSVGELSVGEVYSRGSVLTVNARSGKCPVGEMSGRGNVQSGKCPGTDENGSE